MPFSLFVQLKFKSIDDRDSFLGKIREYASWIEENEKTTIAYKVLQSDKEELQVLVLERYCTKEDYLITHKSSKEFKEFRAFLTALEPEIQGNSYDDTDAGFI